MKSNTQIVSAVLVGVSTWLLGCYVMDIKKKNRVRAHKKLAKAAVQSWEGEGGAIIDTIPIATAG